MVRKHTGQGRPRKGSPGQLKSRSRPKSSVASSVTRVKASDRAFYALNIIRRKGYTLTQALKEAHVSRATFYKYVGRAVLPSKPGRRIRVTRGDRYVREMLLPTALGDVAIRVHGSKVASFLASYRAAVLGYLRRGDESLLKTFHGKSIEGHSLITDPGTLSTLAEAGAIKPEQFYASVGGAA